MLRYGAAVVISAGGLLLFGACSSDSDSRSESAAGTGAAAGTGGSAGSGGGSGGGLSGGSGGGSGGGLTGGTGGGVTAGSGGSDTGGGGGSETGGSGAVGGAPDPGSCCRLVPHSSENCRLFINDWQQCYECDEGCFDQIRPTGPVEPITACGCDGRPGDDRCYRIENRCSHPVRAVDNNSGLSQDLAPGECTQQFVPTNDGVHIHGEINCETGECDPGPHSLIEMNLGDLDWYDISHVDGANLPIGLYLREGADPNFTGPRPGVGQCSCLNRECRVDIKNTTCRPENRVLNSAGEVAACRSQCAENGDASECCRNDGATPCDRPGDYPGPYPICDDYGMPYNCVPMHGAYDASGDVAADSTFVLQADYEMLRFPCPQVYSYAYDEQHEVDGEYVLCTCPDHPDYDVVFCP